MPSINEQITIKSSVGEVTITQGQNDTSKVLDYVKDDILEIVYTGEGGINDYDVYWATGFFNKVFGDAVGVAAEGSLTLNKPLPEETTEIKFDLYTVGWDRAQERNDAIGNQILEFPSFSGSDRNFEYALNLNEVPPPPPPPPPVTGYPAGASEYDPDAVMPYEDSGTTTYEKVELPDTELTINLKQKLDSIHRAVLLTANQPASTTVKFGDEPIGITTSGKKFDNDLAYGFYVIPILKKNNNSFKTLPGQVVKYNDRAEIAIEPDTIEVEVKMQFYGWANDFDLNKDRENNSLSRARTVGSEQVSYFVNTQYERSVAGGSFSDPALIDFSVNADINFSLSSGLSIGAEFDLNVPIMKDMSKFIGEFSGFANAIESNSQTALNTVMGISGNSCPLLNSLGNLVDGALADLAEAAEQAVPNVMAGLNDIVENVRRMIPEMQGFIGDAFEPIKNLMQPIYNALGNALPPLKSIWNDLQAALDAAIPDAGLISSLQSAFNTLKGEIRSVIDVIDPLVSSVNNAFNAVTSQISAISNQVASAVSTAVSELENAFSSITGVMDEALTALNAATCGAVSGLIGSLSADVASKIAAVQDFPAQGLNDFLRDPAAGVISGMRDIAETQLASMETRAQGVMNDVTGNINGFINNSQNIISSGINVDLNFSL